MWSDSQRTLVSSWPLIKPDLHSFWHQLKSLHRNVICEFACETLARCSKVMLRAMLSSRLSGSDLGPNAAGHLYHFLSHCGGVKPSTFLSLSLYLPQFHSETDLKVTHLVKRWKKAKYFLLLCEKSQSQTWILLPTLWKQTEFYAPHPTLLLKQHWAGFYNAEHNWSVSETRHSSCCCIVWDERE